MAFNRQYFTLISGMDTPAGCRLFLYVTTDSLADVIADGYFNGGGDSEFNIGDTIMVKSVDNLNNFVRMTSSTVIVEVTGI